MKHSVNYRYHTQQAQTYSRVLFSEDDSDGESNRSMKMKIKLKGKGKSTPSRKRKQRKYISDDEDYEED